MNSTQRWADFLAHNNAVPLALGILFLGTTSAFAATDPQAVYNTSTKIVSIDNTYIAHKDLSGFTPRAVVSAVTEDATTYYVEYQFSTIDIDAGVWKDVTRGRELKVDKNAIEGTETLGTYVGRQLKETIDAEYRRLVETQQIEQKNVTQKTIATEYGGLIGTMLDTTTVVEKPYEPAPSMDLVAATPGDTGSLQTAAAASASSADGSVGGPTDVSAAPADAVTSGLVQSLPQASGTLTLQVMGNALARVALKSTYLDLGVYVTDAATNNIFTLVTRVDGVDMSLNGVQIDTATVGVHTIQYEAADAKGNRVGGSRTVTVYDPYASTTTVTGTTASSTATITN